MELQFLSKDYKCFHLRFIAKIGSGKLKKIDAFDVDQRHLRRQSR